MSQESLSPWLKKKPPAHSHRLASSQVQSHAVHVPAGVVYGVFMSLLVGWLVGFSISIMKYLRLRNL